MFYIWEVLRKHFSSLSNNIQYNQVSCSILRQSRVQNLEKFKKIAKKWYYSIFVFSIFMMIFSFSELKYEYRSKFQGFKNCLHICGSCRTLFLSNWINIKNFISKKLTPTPKIQKPVILASDFKMAAILELHTPHIPSTLTIVMRNLAFIPFIRDLG